MFLYQFFSPSSVWPRPRVGIWILLVLLVLFSAKQPLWAQDFLTNIKAWHVEDGLSHRDVFAIHQDGDGFMWIGTRNGLNRFDGVQFKWWTQEEQGLASNEIHHILEDKAGWLWLVQHQNWFFHDVVQSISLVNRHTGEVRSLEKHFPQGMPFDLKEVRSITGDKQGALYFGLPEGLVYIYIPHGGFQKFTLPVNLPVYINWIDGQGTIWGQIGPQHKKAEQLFSYAPANDRFQSYPIEQQDCWTDFIGRDETGRVIGYIQAPFSPKEFFYIDPQQGLKLPDLPAWKEAAEQIRRDWSGQVVQDPHTGRLWLSGYPNLLQLSLSEGQLWDFTQTTQDAIQAQVQTLFFDQQGIIWIGTSDGLFQIKARPNPFQNYLAIDYFNYQVKKAYSCRGIFVDQESIWVNTYRGRRKIDRSTMQVDSIPWKTYSVAGQNKYVAAFPLALLEDSQGNLWFSEHHLVCRKPDGQEIVIRSAFEEPNLPTIWSLMEDHSGRIWAGSQKGLTYMDPGDERLLAYQASSEFQVLNQSVIYGFFERSIDTYWLATSNGLFLWSTQEGVLEHYSTQQRPEKSIPHDLIHYVLDEGTDTLWLGTGGGGLVKIILEEGRIKKKEQLTVTAGLLNTNIYAIYPDEYGYLWMSSDNGIVRYRRDGQQIRVFLPKDGTNHHEYNRISHFRDATGRIFFGGLNGVTAFHPRNFLSTEKTYNPKLVITGFQKEDAYDGALVDHLDQLQEDQHLRLRPGERNFLVEFALLDFAAPELIQYAWKIEGLDTDWQYGNEHMVRYNGLPYGQYILRIKGRSSEGEWSSEEIALPLEVQRPLYLQVWFLASLVLGIAFLIYQGFLYQRKRRLSIEEILHRRVQEQTRTIAQQADELRALDRLKSNFFANISHEIRTPLTLILGPINSVLKQTDLPESSQQLLKMARQNGTQLVHLINQILDLTKIDSGKLSLEEQAVPLYSFLRRSLAAFEVLAREREIQFTFRYGAREALRIITDPRKLQKILNNLLSNALKFTPPQGAIFIEVQEGAGNWTLEVRDTGSGIAPEDLPHIFDRFYQSKNQQFTEGEGTGIGLAYCKELVQLLGGTIAVESTLHQGSTFRIQLPLQEVLSNRETPPIADWESKWAKTAEIIRAQVSDTQDWQPAASASMVTTGGLPVILLVEDNQNLQHYIQYFLSPNYQVILAKDGLEGLNWLSRQENILPDLVVSDVMMPRMDGVQLLKKLKSNDQWKQIPVIMLTARAGLSDKISALRIGVDDYLTKPFVEEELVARIENLLAHAKARKAWQAEEAQSLPEQEAEPLEEDQTWLIQLEEFVHSKIGDSHFNVELMAQGMFLSRRQLQRRVRSLTGLTPNQYLNELRLQTARRLLEAGPKNSIKEVAFQVGIRDVKYFSQQFKKRFGRLPSSYRNAP